MDAGVYDRFLEKLKAEVATLTVGPSDQPANYMGPVINASAKKSILEYIEIGKKEGRLIAGRRGRAGRRLLRPADGDRGYRFQGADFPGRDFWPGAGGDQGARFRSCAGIGERFRVRADRRGVSKNPEKIQKARDHFFVGNLYINRKCTGAMVGAHPFGGFNMSGTDSKAGGPDYLLQFLQAKSIAEKIS